MKTALGKTENSPCQSTKGLVNITNTFLWISIYTLTQITEQKTPVDS